MYYIPVDNVVDEAHHDDEHGQDVDEAEGDDLVHEALDLDHLLGINHGTQFENAYHTWERKRKEMYLVLTP